MNNFRGVVSDWSDAERPEGAVSHHAAAARHGQWEQRIPLRPGGAEGGGAEVTPARLRLVCLEGV